MFGLSEIRYANSWMGAGRKNALTRDQVADKYDVQRSAVTRAANNSWRVEITPPVSGRPHVAYVHVQTEVVRIMGGGAVKLTTGGWRTVTTKDRINSFQNLGRVWSYHGAWIVETAKGRFPFEDGMFVHPDGSCSTFEVDPIARLIYGSERLAVKLGNLITEGIERWGGTAGFWPHLNDEPGLFHLLDEIEEAGLGRCETWGVMDPHVHRLGDMTGQIEK